MIGREKMDNNCPHRAEGIAQSVQSFYAMPYAPCNSLIGVNDEDLGDRGLWFHRQ